MHAVDQIDDVAADDQLRVAKGVHQEHLVALFERHTDIEHGRLHAYSHDDKRAAEKPGKSLAVLCEKKRADCARDQRIATGVPGGVRMSVESYAVPRVCTSTPNFSFVGLTLWIHGSCAETAHGTVPRRAKRLTD